MKTIKILNFFSILLISLTLISCGSFKKVDQRQMPDGAKAKARKNIEEGRGVSLGGIIVHQKNCSNTNNCKIQLLTNTKIQSELNNVILQKAALLEREDKNKKKKN